MTDSTETEIYLTNGIGEDVSDGVDLKGLGLGFQDGDDYFPLTAQEEVFVYEEYVEIPGRAVPGGSDAPVYPMLMGYSTLKGGKKYLAPCVEYGFVSEGPHDLADFDRSLADVTAFADAVRGDLEAIGGSATVMQEGLVDRHTVEIRIPMEYALQTADSFEAWTRHLTESLLAGAKPEHRPTPGLS